MSSRHFDPKSEDFARAELASRTTHNYSQEVVVDRPHVVTEPEPEFLQPQYPPSHYDASHQRAPNAARMPHSGSSSNNSSSTTPGTPKLQNLPHMPPIMPGGAYATQRGMESKPRSDAPGCFPRVFPCLARKSAESSKRQVDNPSLIPEQPWSPGPVLEPIPSESHQAELPEPPPIRPPYQHQHHPSLQSFEAMRRDHNVEGALLPNPEHNLLCNGRANGAHGILSVKLNESGGRSNSAPLDNISEDGSTTDLERTWIIPVSEVKFKMGRDKQPKILGSGGFGSVYHGQIHGTQDVAIKVAQCRTEKQKAQFEREMHILKNCHSPHIVMFSGCCFTSGQMLLIMEFMHGGNLWSALHESDDPSEVMWYKRGKEIALEIVMGLVYLHSIKVIHLDLKSPNILLTKDGHAKIADVGLGKMIVGGQAPASESVTGTFNWAAWEQISGQPCSFPADVFAMGVLLWEICSGDQPKKRQYRDLKVPEEAPPAINDLINKCLTTDPAMRPTAQQMFQVIKAHVPRT